jgi:hypothetical protein
MRSSWLYANGLTTGEISAHFAQIYAASVSKETVSRITDKVLEEMATWRAPPLEVYAAIFIDAIRLLGMVKVRDGQVANRRICAAIEATLAGEKDILGCGPALVVRARSSPMCVLTDILNPRHQGHLFPGLRRPQGLPEVLGNGCSAMSSTQVRRELPRRRPRVPGRGRRAMQLEKPRCRNGRAGCRNRFPECVSSSRFW